MLEKESLWPYDHSVTINLWMGDDLTKKCKSEYVEVIIWMGMQV